MKQYVVSWMIDTWAENPKEAAKQVLEIMRNPESIAQVFEVIETGTGTTEIIDLWMDEEDDDE